MNGTTKLHVIIFFAFLTTHAIGAEVNVANQSELTSAMAAAQPGDQIIMADGEWSDAQIILDKPGTVSAPLRLRAKTPGGVILNGSSQLTFAAPYVHVEGLFFKEGTIKDRSPVIRFRSNYCRLADSAVLNYGAANKTATNYWVYFEGSHNTVDRCFFMGKTVQGPLVGNAATGARYNTFSNSCIKDIPHNGGRNGMEIFRIWGNGGNEEIGEDGAFFTIEGSLLERADGEGSEIISFKSNRNRVINNTIRATRGGITFRSANYNTVAGNFILGDGIRGAYGMRVTGRNHVITNNYIADCEYGVNIYAGEFIDEALTESYRPINRNGTPLGRVPSYSWARNNLIANNTLVNNKGADLMIGGNYKSGWPRSQRVMWPAGNIIADNLIIKSADGAAVDAGNLDTQPPLDRFTFQPNTFFGNVVSGGTVKYDAAREGFVAREVKMTKGEDGIFLKAEDSPIFMAGRKQPGAKVILRDKDYQPRRDAPGVGAEELSSTPVSSKPLTADDVGPEWIKIRRKAGETL